MRVDQTVECLETLRHVVAQLRERGGVRELESGRESEANVRGGLHIGARWNRQFNRGRSAFHASDDGSRRGAVELLEVGPCTQGGYATHGQNFIAGFETRFVGERAG